MTAETSNARGLVAKWRTEADALDEKAAEREPDGRLVWAEWMRDRMSFEASTKRGDANELEAALNATPPPPADAEVREAMAREAGHIGFSSMKQCADAWLKVVALLHEVAPGWQDQPGTGCENALAAIRALSQQPEARGVVDDEDGMPVGFAGWYNRTFRTRGADTKHLNDCEEAWRAALTEARNVR